LWWGDLENLVPETIWKDYQRLDDIQRKQYCRELQRADWKRTQYYHTARKGESYALWFHLLRMDNIASAILMAQERLNHDEQEKKYRLKSKMQVLDVGSGTGSGVMALTFIYAKRRAHGHMNFDFTLIEPHLPMRSVQHKILEEYSRLFEGKSAPDAAFTWGY